VVQCVSTKKGAREEEKKGGEEKEGRSARGKGEGTKGGSQGAR
jgi:hypothetical protein